MHLTKSLPDLMSLLIIIHRAQALENGLRVLLRKFRPVEVKEAVAGGEELLKECVRRLLNEDARIVRLRHKTPAFQRGTVFCFYRLFMPYAGLPMTRLEAGTR